MAAPPDELPPDADLRFAMKTPRPADRFLGLELYGPVIENGRVHAYLSQISYARAIIDKLYAVRPDVKLRTVTTPADPNIIEKINTDDDFDTRGVLSRHAASLVGAILWLSRGSRPEISYVTGVLGRYVTKWTVL